MDAVKVTEMTDPSSWLQSHCTVPTQEKYLPIRKMSVTCFLVYVVHRTSTWYKLILYFIDFCFIFITF